MESVMNFLADNYIYFFVAAGILLFALIGFLIDSKRKKGKDFKGEAISNTTLNTNMEVADTPQMETVSAIEPTPVETPKAETNSYQEVNTMPVIEQTMEINDIPMAAEAVIEETPVNPELQNITYGEPISVDNNSNIVEPSTNEEVREEVEPKEEIETFEIFDDLN